VGGLGGAGADGGLAEGGGFFNAGNLSFTAITVNANTNQVIGGDGGAGGNGGEAEGGLGGTGVHGGRGGGVASGNGGHGGNGGAGLGGGGFNTATGTLLIAPRQGAVAGSAQALARSLIRSNDAIGGLAGSGGVAGVASPGDGGGPDGSIGMVQVGIAGTRGVLGVGIGGGLDLATRGIVALKNTVVTTNHATTRDPDVSGTFSQ
jgi:hypothetical protein